MNQSLKQQFYQLTPDAVLNAIDDLGFRTTGEYIQLNSYENRVFQIELEPEFYNPIDDKWVIAKFYRPLRWSESSLLEEHMFLQELELAGVPVINTLEIEGSTLFTSNHIHYCLYKKGLGRIVDELLPRHLEQVGERLAQIHNVGEAGRAHHRNIFYPTHMAKPFLGKIKQHASPEVWSRYEAAALEIFNYMEDMLDPKDFIRIHGDCHRGNLLLQDLKNEPTKFFFIDFDDFGMGPVEQDFWMLLSDAPRRSKDDIEALLTGYNKLRDCDFLDVELMEAMRGFRIVHYAGWIAQRWDDPTFPQLFPQFHDYNYWASEVEQLEQIAWSL